MASVFGTDGYDTITPYGVSPGVTNKPTDADDRIWGFDGNDILDGGPGRDLLWGGPGDEIYYLLNGVDGIMEKAGEGIDKVFTTSSYALTSHVENLQLVGSASINGVGNSLDNEIIGNNWANIIDGGAGNDTLFGEGGNDIYYVDSILDKIVEDANKGVDEVRTSNTHVLSNHVENLRLMGSISIRGTGNSLDNKITGNRAINRLEGRAGKDTLLGEGGDDTLKGGLDNDTLTGGSGADHFQFFSPDGSIDTITDFKWWEGDKISVFRAGFNLPPGRGSLLRGPLSLRHFRIGAAAVDGDDYFIYNAGTGALSYDADGVGGQAQVQFAQLATGLPLISSDIVVL